MLEQEARADRIERILIIIGSSLVLLFLATLYFALRQRFRRAALEKEKTDLELAYRKQELTSFAVQLAQKQSVLEGVKQDIKALDRTDDDGLRSLIKTLDHNLQEEAGWEQFVRMFEELKPTFTADVRSRHPDLTTHELRLMALIKLNLANHDIASLLNISKDGVKKARYRLRKKLQLDQGQDLDAVVQAI